MASIAKQHAQPAPGEQALRELRQLREENAQLVRAVNQSRDINVVVGIVMERFKLDRQAAFEALRTQARARRLKLDELALALLGAGDQLQRLGVRAGNNAAAGRVAGEVASGPAGKADDGPTDH